jgi:hypothetical protein
VVGAGTATAATGGDGEYRRTGREAQQGTPKVRVSEHDLCSLSLSVNEMRVRCRSGAAAGI